MRSINDNHNHCHAIYNTVNNALKLQVVEFTHSSNALPSLAVQVVIHAVTYTIMLNPYEVLQMAIEPTPIQWKLCELTASTKQSQDTDKDLFYKAAALGRSTPSCER